MSKLYISDHLFEVLFRQAVIDNFNRQLAKIPCEEELSKTIAFSARHELRMKKLFVYNNRKERIKAVLKWVKKIAAIIVLTISILFGTLMTVPDVRAAVTETLIFWFDQFSKFISTETVIKMERLEPSYIPEGYVESERIEIDNFLSILYVNNSGDILSFTVVSADDSVSADNENRVYSEITIENINYHIFDGSANEKDSDIIWEYGGYRYLISAPIPMEKLLKMALLVK